MATKDPLIGRKARVNIDATSLKGGKPHPQAGMLGTITGKTPGGRQYQLQCGDTLVNLPMADFSVLDAARLVQGVEVFAVQVLDELHHHRVGVVCRHDVHWHPVQACDARGRKSAFARDDFVRGVARGLVFKRVLQARGGQAAHQQGLEYAVHLHGGGHLQQGFVFDDLPVGSAAHQDRQGQDAVAWPGWHGCVGCVGIQHAEVGHGHAHLSVATLKPVAAAAR